MTKSADATLGTPARVVIGVDSFVNGHMFAFVFAANADSFDQVLPSFEKMINSFHTGSGTVPGSSDSSVTNEPSNLLH